MLADIHGNADALAAVLTDARQQGAEHLLVNGDVVNRGPDSVAVLETLLSRDDVTFTLGNHDDLLRLWHTRSDKLPQGWYADPFWGATGWSAEQLHAAGLLDVPESWPLTQTLEAAGLPRVLVTHGSPDDYRRGLSERSDPAQVRRIVDEFGAGLLVGSHIHRQADGWVSGVRVLNTGAVGSPADGDPRAQYLLLTAQAGGWDVNLRRVPYDRSGVLRRFETSGLLATGLSAQIFREELVTARSLYTPYWEWTESGGRLRDAASWEQFARDWT